MRNWLFLATIMLLSQVSFTGGVVRAQEAGGFNLTTIVTSGDPLASEVTFSQFGAAEINDAGQVAFIAGDGSGLYLLSEGTMIPVAVSGGPVPGLEESFFGEFTALALNNLGDLAFIASVIDTKKQVGLFLAHGGTGTIEQILSSGDRVPGAVFANFQDFRDLHLNDQREVAVTGIFRSIESGAFLISGGEVNPIAIANQEAPGTDGGQFRSAEARGLANNGTVLIQGQVRDGTAAAGIYLFQDGELRPVALTGQEAPGTDGGMFFRFSHATLISESGDIVFESFVLGQDTATGGIFKVVNGEAEAVVFGGQPVEVAGGRSILEFAPIATNGQGDFAFRVMFEQQERGLFFYTEGKLALVVSSDESVTGSIADRFIPSGSTSVNAERRIAFVGETAGPTTTGIYLRTEAGITAAVTSRDAVPSERRLRLATAVGLNDEGAVAFTGVVTGNGAGSYMIRERVISPLLVSGQEAPNSGGGLTRTLTDVVGDRLALTGRGEMAAASSITGGTTPEGVFRVAVGMVESVALADELVSGLPDTLFLDFDQVVVGPSGAVAFSTILDQGDDVVEGIVLSSNGGDRLVAVAGQHFAGADDELFSFLSQPLWVNEGGEVTFVGELIDGRVGVFLSSHDRLTAIALSETEAPETAGQTFESFGNVMINRQGAVVFDCEFSDGGGGVFVFANDQLRPVVLSGDEVPGVPGQTFRSFRRAALNDRGDIAFTGRWGFRGGQGVFFLSGGVLTPVATNAEEVEAGLQFSNIFGLALNNRGELVFSAALGGASGPSVIVLATPDTGNER